MKARLFLCVATALLVACPALAQFVWTGAAGDHLASNSANWDGGIAPTGAGGEDFIFGDSSDGFVTVSDGFRFQYITVTSVSTGYFVGTMGTDQVLEASIVTTAGSGGFFVFNGDSLSLGPGVHLFDTQGSFVYVFGDLVGTGDMLKTGNSGLVISSADNSSTYSGNISLDAGSIAVAGDGALGTGQITMNGGQLFASHYDQDRIVALNNSLQFTDASADFTSFNGELPSTLIFSGGATIGASTMDASIQVTPLASVAINGGVGEINIGSTLTKNGGGTLILRGPLTYTGGTSVNAGVLIFGEDAPLSGLVSVGANAYFGTEVTSNLQAHFLGRIDPASTGIIGFDSPDPESPLTFSENIDLTGFDPAIRIGTATVAYLNSYIIPLNNTYQFGGRGVLYFSGNLEDDSGMSRDVVVSDGLLMYTTDTNLYTGQLTTRTGGALIFDGYYSPSGTIKTEAGGYVGLADGTSDSTGNFLGRFDASGSTGVIGFDSHDIQMPATLIDPIDLTGFNTLVMLGTATKMTFAGTITPQDVQYRFTGFRDGQLTVQSTLSDVDGTTPRNVVIGQTAGDVFTDYGATVYHPSVTLSSANTYTGGTLLQSGELILGHASALGTGPLTIGSFSPVPTGLSTTANLSIANDIIVSSNGTNGFLLHGANNYTLSGAMSGGNAELSILKDDANTVTISGANGSLASGFTVRQGGLIFTNFDSAGTGTLNIINDGSGGAGYVEFTLAPAQMGTLKGESDAVLNLNLSGRLTIVQNSDETFAGTIIGSGGITLFGNSTLTLSNPDNVFTGTSYIRTGGLVVTGGVNQGSGFINVGQTNGDVGSLTVASGGSFHTYAVTVGNQSGSSGQVTLSGGSVMTVDADFTVANQGDGNVTIDDSSLSSGGSFVGENGIAYVTVTGSSALWSTTNEIIVGAFSPTGSGTLEIINGGTVNAGLGSVGYVGNGTVSIHNPSSAWNTTGRLWVGSGGGYGLMEIYDSGSAHSSSGEIGIDGAVGGVDLKTSGTWTIDTDLLIGNNGGTGQLFVFGNGTLNVNSGAGLITLGGTADGTGSLTIGAPDYAGGIINAAEIHGGPGTAHLEFATTTTSASPYYLTKDATAGGTSVLISGNLYVRNVEGYNVLGGTNTYTGGTHLVGGTLVAGSAGAFGSGTIYFEGGGLGVANGVVLTNPLDLSGGGTLGGTGTIGSHITAGTGVILSPGNSPGTLTFNSGLTWSDGGQYDWQLQTNAGGAGTSTGWDLIAVTGQLDMSSLSAGGFTLKLISLDGSSNPGSVSDFNPAAPMSWTIATTTTGIVGFNAANILIDASEFVDYPSATNFSLSVSGGNDLVLNFSPVPEPSTYVLLGLGLLGLLRLRRR